MTHFVQHRINTVRQLEQVPKEYGVEVDLRDHGDRILMQHDPYITDEVEDFEDFLAAYQHGTLICNVKSERIEHRVQEMLKAHRIPNYFFLDSSFPMIRLLADGGERRCAVRYSELEPIEYALSLAGKIDWVWVDCFTYMPLDHASYRRLKEHFRICIVSPELQGRSVDEIEEFTAQLAPFEIDAICTKRPDLWQHQSLPQRRAA